MPFCQVGAIRYFQFEFLQESRLVQAVFTRRGGVSPEPWAALNLGGTVGDDPQRVIQNRRLALQAVGRPVESIYDVWQVHSAEVVCCDQPRQAHTPPLQADAILTDRPEVTLLMRFADCVPIVLHDPIRGVAGLAHAGWLGTIRQTAAAAVQAMKARYGSRPADLWAGIGPSIGPDHYEIGPEVADQVRQVFGAEAGCLLLSENGRVHLDLWSANRLILEHAGVRKVEVAGICTACSLEDWYSHRAEKGITGRFGAVLALKEG